MATFAVIKDGIVENCIVADSLEIAQEVTGLNCVEYSLNSGVVPGWSYVNNEFIAPVEIVIEEEIDLVAQQESNAAVAAAMAAELAAQQP